MFFSSASVCAARIPQRVGGKVGQRPVGGHYAVSKIGAVEASGLEAAFVLLHQAAALVRFRAESLPAARAFLLGKQSDAVHHLRGHQESGSSCERA